MTTAKMCPMSRQACRADCMMYDAAKGKCAILWACYQAGEAARRAQAVEQAVKDASVETVTYLKAVEDTVSASARAAAQSVTSGMAAAPVPRVQDESGRRGKMAVSEGVEAFVESIDWWTLVNRKTGDVYRNVYVPWCMENGYEPSMAAKTVTVRIRERYPLKLDGGGSNTAFVVDGSRL